MSCQRGQGTQGWGYMSQGTQGIGMHHHVMSMGKQGIGVHVEGLGLGQRGIGVHHLVMSKGLSRAG
jgi:hypothetical protein